MKKKKKKTAKTKETKDEKMSKILQWRQNFENPIQENNTKKKSIPTCSVEDELNQVIINRGSISAGEEEDRQSHRASRWCPSRKKKTPRVFFSFFNFIVWLCVL